MANEFEITKVRLIIRQFLWETRKAVESAEAAQKWLIQFRNTLEYQELEENPDAYALAILAEARSFNNTKQRNQQMRWVRAALEKDGIKNPTDEQLEECWMELYGRPEKTTADGDTREDSHDEKSGTSAKNSEARQSQRTGGGSAKGTGCSIVPPARNSGRKFLNKEEFIQWAIDNGLDPIDANECWEATVERGWKDADGNPIKNIMAYAIQWCKTRETNRRTA